MRTQNVAAAIGSRTHREFVEQTKKDFPAGTRVVLIRMNDRQAVPSGTKGTVKMVDDAGQLMMSWDNGRTLALIPGEDEFRVLTTDNT